MGLPQSSGVLHLENTIGFRDPASECKIFTTAHMITIDL